MKRLHEIEREILETLVSIYGEIAINGMRAAWNRFDDLNELVVEAKAATRREQGPARVAK